MERFDFWMNVVQALATAVFAGMVVWALWSLRRAPRDHAELRTRLKLVVFYGCALVLLGLNGIPPFEDTLFDDLSLPIAGLMMLGTWLWERRVARNRSV